MYSGKMLLHGATLCAALAATTATAAPLDVYITNVRPTKTVQVSVFKDADSWARQEQPLITHVVAARGTAQTVRIEGLSPGRYAVRVRQEPNHIGFAEPLSFGFARSGASGNASRYGVGDFERSAVELGAAGARVFVRLRIRRPF